MDHATIEPEDYQFEQPEFTNPNGQLVVVSKPMDNYSLFMIFLLTAILAYVSYIAYVSSTSLFEEDKHMRNYADYTMKNIKKKRKLNYRR